MVGSQGIFKGTVFLDVQRTTLLNIFGNIEVVDKVFRLYRLGNAINLCVCLFVGIVAIDTDTLMLMLIVNGSTVILEPVILHSSVYIALGSFFCFLQSVVVQFVIETIFKVMVSGDQITPNYQIVIDRVNNTDTFDVNVEMSESFFSDDVKSIEKLERTITENLRSMLGISAKVHLVNPKSIVRSEGKAKRVIDNRKGKI